MPKYRIEFDRTNCIGAAACAAVYPDKWVMKDDGKPDIVGAEPNPEKQELIVENEEEARKHIEAAKSCPVLVIHVTNLDTGEKII